MLTKEIFVDIHVRHQQGQSMRQIARELGISRNTVKKHLHQGQWPAYQRRPDKPSKLDPFKPYLKQRVEAAKPHWIPASVLFDELKEKGFDGGISILRQYLAPFKQVKAEPVVRFETEPGHQMQIDFTTIRRGKHTLKAFVATLGYCRASFVKFYDNERAEAWQEGLIEAFDYFGGVPRQVLCDNAKALILERDAYAEGHHRFHPGMLQLAKDFGFQLKACRPYRAQTKGKVERFNHYLKHSFVIPLAAQLKVQGLVLDVAMANAKVGPWLVEVAHQRVHGTTGQPPQQLLDKERESLQPLPTRVAVPCGQQSSNRLPAAPPSESMTLQHPINLYDQLLGGEHDTIA